MSALSVETTGASAEPMSVGHYDAFGMHVLGPSRFLDGHCHARLSQADDGSPELSIEVVHELPSVESGWVTLLTHDPVKAAAAGHRFLSVQRGPADARRYQIIDGLAVHADPAKRRLLVCVPPTMHRDSVGSFVLGTAMLCYFKAQQRLCLHAAVATQGERTVMICGASGAGKSSLAAALLGHGWQIVVEDLAVVEAVQGGLGVRPGYGRLRLWSDSVGALGLDARTSQIVVGADKHYLPLAVSGRLSAPIDALVFLGARLAADAPGPQLRAISAGASALARLYNQSLAAYLNPPDEIAPLLAQCRQLLAQCDVHELRLVDDWARLDAGCAEITRRLLA